MRLSYGKLWKKKCKICGDKLIKKGFDTANNQIWYCKHCHKHYVFKRKDNHDRLWIYRYIDFLSENKKIEDFNVSKSTFYRKISKFRNTNIFLPGMMLYGWKGNVAIY